MENLPKYWILDRRLVGAMDMGKRIVEGAAAISAVTHNEWVAAALLLLRIGLSFAVSSATIKNPINVTATQTISQPEPIKTDTQP